MEGSAPRNGSAAEAAGTGFKAMIKGEAGMDGGWRNRLRTALGPVTPAGVQAEMHRAQAEPGSEKA